MANEARRLACIALVIPVLSACGDSSEPSKPEFTGSPEEQIAKTVNAMFAAWNAGDGELTCSYLTEDGRNWVLKYVPQFPFLEEEIDPDSCEDAVEMSRAATEGTYGQHAAAQRVQINPDGTASVHSRFRGAVTLREVDGEWLIEVPYFFD